MEFSLREPGTVVKLDIRLDDLSTVLVRDAADCRLLDCGVEVDGFLHHTGVDIEPAADDEVLNAVDDKDESVFVHIADVTGAQASAVQHGAGLFRALPITGHDLRSGDTDFSTLAKGDGLARIVERNDLDESPGKG